MRPNEGRKRRGKQAQPPGRFKPPFGSGRSSSGSYPYPQQPQPAEDSRTSLASPPDDWAETQQVRGERTSRCNSQGSSRSTPPWEAWKLFRSSKTKSHGEVPSSTTKIPKGQKWKTPRSSTSCQTYRKGEGTPPENIRPQFTPAPSVPIQPFESWDSANMTPFSCFACAGNGCFHSLGAGTTHQDSAETSDERISCSMPEVMLNSINMLERNLGNIRLGGVFSNYRYRPNECMLDPPLCYTEEIGLDTEMDVDDDSSYYHPNSQRLSGFSTTEIAEEYGYYSQPRLDFVMDAMGRYEGVYLDDFEAMGAFDEEDSYNMHHDFFNPYMQIPPRHFRQEPGPVASDTKLVFAEVSKQIELYNTRWTAIQQRTATSPTPSIPWPSQAPSFSREGLLKADMQTRLPPEHRPKYTVHRFFCHAFGLHPLWDFQDDCSFGIGCTAREAKSTSIEKMNGLKSQLKLEKVRWHEDKMKAVFGPGVASDECVKEVWSVVISLKGEVERELEKLGV